jgi:hypothetical protein
MRIYVRLFAAWTTSAAASTALRLIAHWPPWRIGEAASIAVASIMAVIFAVPIRAQRVRGPEWAVVAHLLLGWLVITATASLLSGDIVAGVDALLYLPALIATALTMRARIDAARRARRDGTADRDGSVRPI